jgi:hypothetical protein
MQFSSIYEQYLMYCPYSYAFAGPCAYILPNRVSCQQLTFSLLEALKNNLFKIVRFAKKPTDVME